jgi:acid phosphatase (class A)
MRKALPHLAGYGVRGGRYNARGLVLSASSLVLMGLSGPLSAQTAPLPKPARVLHFLTEAELRPSLLVPPPPAPGSIAEKAQIAELHRIVAAASPERLAQARADDKQEDPSIFDEALGVDLKRLPATWELLTLVHNEANVATNSAKEYFHRVRPWSVDPTLANCDAGTGKPPTRSYPSGHSSLSYSVGFVLAQLVPDKADVVLRKAQDYAESREICGVHYPSDTEASHVIGTAVAAKLLASPAFRARLPSVLNELREAHLIQS